VQSPWCKDGLLSNLCQMTGQIYARSLDRKKKSRKSETFRSALGRTRTCDLLIRSQTLYPAELRAHRSAYDTAGWGISQGRCPSGRFCGYTSQVVVASF
jgi:hypothetical protein